MVLREFAITTNVRTRQTKQAIEMICDVCGTTFIRAVNVRKWRNSPNHRCSIKCFGQDCSEGGYAYKNRRNTCMRKYGVPSVVVQPSVLAHNAIASKRPEVIKKKLTAYYERRKETAWVLKRGLTLCRSRGEIACLDLLSTFMGPVIPQKYINGWWIDGYFSEVGVWVQYDGAYWHRKTKLRDDEQDAWFKANGKVLLRITDKEYNSWSVNTR